MISFTLNGKSVKANKDENLLTYLRDKAHLTSVKNGCAGGVCGACTVLVDGKKVRACTLSLRRVSNCSLLTVEGLTKKEKEIFAYAFGHTGAVQCGFCTPGMVMSAKALIDINPDPTPQDVKKGIHNNLCRCTGYVKIEKGILLAAKLFRDGGAPKEEESSGGVGESMVRRDSLEKTLGMARYCGDVYMDGMLHAKVLRTSYPKAKILSIDTSSAKTMPGVVLVLTAEDIPGEIYNGYIVHDWPVLVPIGDRTRYIGDALALVAAETTPQALAAIEMIHVEYDIQKPVNNPIKAMQENAQAVHDTGNILKHVYINRGAPEEALAMSKYLVSNTFKLPFTEHAFIEPESTVAFYEDNILNVFSASQDVYKDLKCLSRILALPIEKIRVRSLYIGGGFGGKEDMVLQHHAALLTYYTKRPVKLTFTREESLRVHPKRHPMDINITLGADREGNFTVLKSRIVSDTGAYASLGSGVLRRAVTHSCGPYKIPAVEMEGFAVYTNNPPAGAYRGYGVTQSTFALECSIDMLAEKLGMDRWEIRYKNALKAGDPMGFGQISQPDTAIKETLMAVKPIYLKALAEGKQVGIACAFKNSGMGGGKEDIGRVNLKIKKGRIMVYTSAQCIGQGLNTVIIQIIAETTGISAESISSIKPDTFLTPDAGPSTASRQTLVTGEAARLAAIELKKDLNNFSMKEMEGRTYEGEYSAKTDKFNDPFIEHPINHVAYSFATNLVVLGEDNKLERVIAAHDVGRAINPMLVEGQIEGGVVMGLGYALRENFIIQDGYIKSRFGTLGLLRSTDIPEIVPIIIGKQVHGPSYSAKGIGEISTIAVAPAVASAFRASDGMNRLVLPLENTPYRKNPGSSGNNS